MERRLRAEKVKLFTVQCKGARFFQMSVSPRVCCFFFIRIFAKICIAVNFYINFQSTISTEVRKRLGAFFDDNDSDSNRKMKRSVIFIQLIPTKRNTEVVIF